MTEGIIDQVKERLCSVAIAAVRAQDALDNCDSTTANEWLIDCQTDLEMAVKMHNAFMMGATQWELPND